MLSQGLSVTVTSENPLNSFSDYHLPFISILIKCNNETVFKECINFKRHLISIPLIKGGVTTNACKINLNPTTKTRKMSPNNSPPS